MFFKHVIIILSTSLLCICNCEDEVKKLPSIFKDAQDGGGRLDQAYRIMGELQLLESGKSFMIEEWASSVQQAFRMDIIESTDGKRSTVLALSETKEYYKYKPFECDFISEIFDALSLDLEDKFPNSDSFVKSGIGSLWLHALKLESTFETPVTAAINRDGDERSTRNVIKGFSRYTVPETEDFLYQLSFYFRNIDSESQESLAIIDLIAKREEAKVVMRIKLIEIEIVTSRKQRENSMLGVFDLPLGYGCKRGYQYDLTLAIPKQPKLPSIIQLNIILFQPIDKDHDYDKWKSHQSSFRMITGGLAFNERNEENNYISIELESYALEEAQQVGGSKQPVASFRRQKQVWDLGGEKLDLKLSIDKPFAFYEIDDRTGRCTSLGYTQLNDGVSPGFPITPINQQFSGTNLSRIVLSTEFIHNLLFEPYDYHLVQEESSNPSKSKTFLYERREKRFELKDKVGELIWVGPVSIIRKITVYLTDIKAKPSAESQDSVTILFLSQELDRVVTKLHLNVADKRLITKSYLHHELDVSSCFNRWKMRKSNISEYNKKSNRFYTKSLDFVLSYLVENREIAERLSSSEHSESIIYEQFLAALASVSKFKLDLLQLVDVNIGFGQDMIKIRGSLLEKPSIMNYREIKYHQFATKKSEHIFLEFKPDEESCAESCDHYSCYMFTYCSTTSGCQLLMRDTKQVGEQLLVDNFDCSVYIPIESKLQEQRRINPAELIHRMRRAILTESKMEYLNLLTLKVEYLEFDNSKRVLDLVPSSIESGLFDSEEVEEMVEDVEKGENDNKEEITRVNPSKLLGLSANLLQPEYRVLFENRRFKRQSKLNGNFPINEANYMNHADCESLCDEIDCRSFSHCQMEKTCLVSQLHTTKEIELEVEEESHCFVVLRDYLSKFQKSTGVSNPKRSSRMLNAVETSHDCAISCMEESSFTCRSFHFCPQENDCYLQRNHLMSKSNLRQPTGSGQGLQTSNDKDQTCDLYTRSFLAEFDRFYGRALPDWAANSGIMFVGLGAELCAFECATKNGDCQAFHICRNEESQLPSCVTLQRNKQVASRDIISFEELSDRASCATFIVSRDSGLNGAWRRARQSPTSDSDIDSSESSTSIKRDTSSEPDQVSLFGMLTLGLIGGYLLALLLYLRSSSDQQ